VRSSCVGQGLDRFLEAGPDLVVGQAAVLEARVRMRDGQLEVEDARADCRQHLSQLGLCPDRPEASGARADDGHGLVPERVRRDRARDPVDRVLSWPGIDELYSGVEKNTASAAAIASFKRATLSGRGWTSSSSSYGGICLRPS